VPTGASRVRESRAALAAQRAALISALLFFLLPIAWLFSTAYKPARDIFSRPPTLGFTATLDNFHTIFDYFNLPQLLQSSLTIALGSTALALLLGVPAGYALARSGWRWAAALVYAFLAVRMVPPVATLIPFYILMRDAGLLGTVWAVILIHATLNTSFVVWMMFAYFRSLPREVEEAALVDGCTPLGTFLRIAVPLVRPGMVASALLCLILSWNDFLYAAFLTRADTKTLSVALLSAYGTKDITWGTMGALAHFSTLPILALALLLNRYFVQGLTRGVH
jgi:multiple sugar transport system permease protein